MVGNCWDGDFANASWKQKERKCFYPNNHKRNDAVADTFIAEGTLQLMGVITK